MKKIFFLILMALLPMVASAQILEATIDGINYQLSKYTQNALITYGNTCSGELDIPSEVNYDGETFEVRMIVWNAFVNCPELTKVRIPKTILGILNYVPVPDRASMIFHVSADHQNPFSECTALESIEVDEENPNMKSVDGVLFNKDGTRLYCYPAGKQHQAYTIPETVTWIGADAFSYNQHLTTLTIPSSVTSIGEFAFAECNNLKDVYCYAEDVPSTGGAVFGETPTALGFQLPIASATLHVPANSVKKYRHIYPWSEFGSIVPIITVQDEDYIPLLADGKVWIYKEKDLLGYYPDHSEWDKIYSLEGDTVIDSQQCLKLYLTCQSPHESYNHSFIGAMFEEGEKVYYIKSGSTTPDLTYDFSLNPGIILVRMHRLYINDIKLTKYRGNYLRVIHWRNIEIDADGLGFWIESVGGLIDLINSISIGNSIRQSELITCKVNDQIIYDRDEFMESVLADPVTYTKDQMATIILPTAPDASKGKYYKLDKCEDGQIIFKQEPQPQARTPYIIVPNEDFSINMSTLDVAGLNPDTVTVGGISFIGSYVRMELPALTGGDGGGSSSSYYDIIDTTPDCQGAASGTEMSVVGALRAYLVVNWNDPITPGGARSPMEKMEIVLHDDGTGISDAERLNDKGQMINDNSVYNLSGQRVGVANGKLIMYNGQLKPGIYIVGGKKILVK